MEYEDREYKIGDHVEVINYGSLYYSPTTTSFKFLGMYEGLYVYDPIPHVLGKQGIIDTVSNNGNSYGIAGINEHSWYNKQQLKLIDV